MIGKPLLALLLLAGGCSDLPRDPAGTLERVRGEGRFRVGLVSSDDPVAPEKRSLFLSRVAAEAGAQPVVEAGAAEPLLHRLEQGGLDLVVGEFAPKSPWKKKVAFLPPLADRDTADGRVQLIAAARNGENGWIALLHGPARELTESR